VSKFNISPAGDKPGAGTHAHPDGRQDTPKRPWVVRVDFAHLEAGGRLSLLAAWVFLRLEEFTRGRDFCYPSLATLAAAVGRTESRVLAAVVRGRPPAEGN
jgi:hypothetical protein